LDEDRSALADFFNASRLEEIVFGNNMTSLTFAISHAIAREWQPGDEIVVTRLDHDANITPWVMEAEDRGCTVRWVDFYPDDGTLDLESFQKALEGQPWLVAFGYASNALATINPVAKLICMAHDACAWVYIDAVQHAPHGPIDVQYFAIQEQQCVDSLVLSRSRDICVLYLVRKKCIDFWRPNPSR